MKTLIIFCALFIICTLTCTFAQAKIKFDTTIYDYGVVEESGSSLVAKYWFTNIGTEPLTINRVQTSGGGLAPGRWPKETILPGNRDYIILNYDGRRIGPINKTATVTTNAVNDSYIVLQVRGEILLKKTTITVNNNETDIGTIRFGEVDTISFVVTNTGNEPLYFNFLENYNTPIIDLFYRNLSLYNPVNSNKNPLERPKYGKIVAEPGEMIRVQICLRNSYGNVGQIERFLYFKYNSHDTLKYLIRADYIGEPFKENVYEQNCMYEYKEDKLVKRTSYNTDGTIRQINNFQDGYLINSIEYNFPYDGDKTEYFYKNDLMIEKKVTKKKDKQD